MKRVLLLAAATAVAVFVSASEASAQAIYACIAGNGKVTLRRRLRDRLGGGSPRRAGLTRHALGFGRAHAVELIGKTAAAPSERQRQQTGTRRQTPSRAVPTAPHSSITGQPGQRSWRRRHDVDTPENVRHSANRTPDFVNEW